MTEDILQGNSTKERLTDTEVMALLRTGHTYAAEIIGDLPLNYLEALAEGLVPDFRASVLGVNNRLPRRLAERGGEVRIAPLPVIEDRWQLQVFQAEGVLGLSGRGQQVEETTRVAATHDFRRGIANFDLFAPFDGHSFSSSWEAHPHKLRSEYMTMMTRPKRYYGRLSTESRLMPGLRWLQGILALLSGTLTGFSLLQGRPITLSLLAIASGLLSLGCYFYVQYTLRRLNRVIAAADGRPDAS